MAFAIASGLTPQAGIYCAIVTGFLISALGGSRVQIGGPTGAFVVVVSGIVAEHGISGLFMCTMMAGVLLVILGLTGTGSVVRFIPRPVVIGFTNGIAVLIASTQIRDFLGLRMTENPGEFVARLAAIGRHLDTTGPAAVGLAVLTLVLVVATNRFVKGIPGTVVGLVVGTAVAWLAGLPVDTVASRFGAVPSGLPDFHLPEFRPSLILTLLSPAITVGLLGAIESLMSAVVADRMSGDRHNPNVELVAQGVANIVSPMFGGLPATGAIARTATNVRSGARTPVAGMIHAVTLLAVLIFGAGLAGTCADGRARRHPLRRRGEHGRVARDSRAAASDQDRHRRLGDDVCADGVRRSHGRRRSRDDSRGAPLYPPRRGDDHGRSGHASSTSKRAASTSCRTRTFPTTSRSCASTGRSCSGRPTSCRASSIASTI